MAGIKRSSASSPNFPILLIRCNGEALEMIVKYRCFGSTRVLWSLRLSSNTAFLDWVLYKWTLERILHKGYGHRAEFWLYRNGADTAPNENPPPVSIFSICMTSTFVRIKDRMFEGRRVPSYQLTWNSQSQQHNSFYSTLTVLCFSTKYNAGWPPPAAATAGDQ